MLGGNRGEVPVPSPLLTLQWWLPKLELGGQRLGGRREGGGGLQPCLGWEWLGGHSASLSLGSSFGNREWPSGWSEDERGESWNERWWGVATGDPAQWPGPVEATSCAGDPGSIEVIWEGGRGRG